MPAPAFALAAPLLRPPPRITSRCMRSPPVAVASGEPKAEVQISDGVAHEELDFVNVSESAIQSLDDVEEMIALVDEFGLYDFRVESHGVSVEICRRGGRGFEDGKLAKIESAAVPVVTTVEEAPVVVEEEEVETVASEQVVEPVVEEAPKDPEMVYETDFVVQSNRVGFFYSGAKNKPPLVNVGDHVDFNQPVCIIEQLGQQYVYLSEASGTVSKVFVEDGDAVEYGQDVMVIRPD